jgi:hypothetical protein
VNQENKILGLPQSRVARILAIQQMAETDPGMRELWDQLEMLYNLKNTNG